MDKLFAAEEADEEEEEEEAQEEGDKEEKAEEEEEPEKDTEVEEVTIHTLTWHELEKTVSCMFLTALLWTTNWDLTEPYADIWIHTFNKLGPIRGRRTVIQSFITKVD